MKTFAFVSFFLWVVVAGFGQSVSKLKHTQQGKNIAITYSITGLYANQAFQFDLFCSTNDGASWGSKLSKITGNTGKLSANSAGNYTGTLTWDVLAERNELVSDKVKFKIVVTPDKIEQAANDDCVLITGGKFSMGGEEYTEHQVTLSDYYISKYEVSQKLYQQAMNKNPSLFKGDNLPVETVNWYDAIEFCNAYSKQDKLTPCYTINGTNVTCNFAANGYRLPTEAEWEYAARGGIKSKGYKYSGSDSIDDVAEYEGNNNKTTKPVGGKNANELGIYDMSGNVWEWCWDWYDGNYYANSPENNPKGADTGSGRVKRGGSWFDSAAIARVVYRSSSTPTVSGSNLGFRVVRTF